MNTFLVCPDHLSEPGAGPLGKQEGLWLLIPTTDLNGGKSED